MQEQVNGWKGALDRLIKGNERFVSGLRSADALLGHVKLKQLAESGQRPFAVILSCSDSRVPVELLFDCGFGDLFVIRVAGNVVQPSQIASIEYAAKVLGSPLCVVMGHSKCGAVQAALDSETGKKVDLGPNIALLIDLIRPSVQRCLSQKEEQAGSLIDCCIRENVRATAHEVLEKSPLLRSLAAENRFHVIETVFRLETGHVDFVVKE
jgi:carbonic anhydrase